MPRRPFLEDDEPIDFGPGPYDGAEGELPAPPDAFPLPRAGQLRPWREAEAALAAELAALAFDFGLLFQRLQAGPPGWRRRLALLEAADMGWWAGEHLPLDRLILAAEDRLSGAAQRSPVLMSALWAIRRLEGQVPLKPETAALAVFLGRGREGLPPGPDVQALASLLGAAAALHPATRGAIAFHHWRSGGAGGPEREIEAAVLAACLSGAMAPAQVFVPLALSAGAGLRASGSAQDRLTAWYAGATRATRAALMHLDRLGDWQQRAQAALSGLSGRTPARIADLIHGQPVVSAPMVEAACATSRAAAQRNLERLEQLGLLREITGQGRFRLWTARL